MIAEEREFVLTVAEVARTGPDDLGAYVDALDRARTARRELVRRGFTREELRDLWAVGVEVGSWQAGAA